MSCSSEKRPNILWIFVEDLSPFIGAYGDETNRGFTPAIDRLAKTGVLFERAYVTSPVCSASRSAIITGVMQTTIGAHQHRSSRAEEGTVVPEELRIMLPASMKTVPELMRDAGYFTFNSGKDDYNFHYNRRDLYDVGTKADYVPGQNGWQGNSAEATYRRSPPGEAKYLWESRPDKAQPWFGQIELGGGKEKNRYVRKGQKLDLEDVPLPAYFPDTPEFREAWSVHFNAVRGTDAQVEDIINRLKKDGEFENTIIFFFSDHGSNTSIRHKQFCYDGGIHIPLIIAGNHQLIRPGMRRREIVSSLDIAATTLALGGAIMPAYLDGQDLFGETYRPVDYIISARDRCDYTIDRIRAVTGQKYSYIRNYFPERPLMQPQYRDDREPNKSFRQLYEAGELSDYHAKMWFEIRPEEELYDLEADPDQLTNLATDPAYQTLLQEKRNILDRWINITHDRGKNPEDPKQLEAVYNLWKDKDIVQGRQLNPEYDPFIK